MNMTEQKLAAIGPLTSDVQQEISRLTATVAKLEGPPTTGAKRAEAVHQDNAQPALLEKEQMLSPDHPEWHLSAAKQMSAIASQLVTRVKANGSNPKDPLLPLAHAALDLSNAALKAGVTWRAKAEAIAKQPKIPDNQDMTDITREELDAKLGATEARMDGRIVELTGKIDGYIGRMEERDKRNDERFAGFAGTLSDIKTELRDTKSAIGSMKTTVITTGIGSVLAIVLGVAAFNATVLSNMVASFESGKGTAMAISESTKRLEQLQDRIEAQQKQATAPPK